MLDNVSLDQLRVFIAAVEEGSFSAAGRRLRRAQSVVSQTIGNLEAQLGLKLFDRDSRMPKLSDAGRSLLGEARAVAGGMDLFKARAKGLADGLEPELSVVVDVMFPIAILTCAVSTFQAQFPVTPLRLYVEALGAVVPPVLDGRCAFGIAGPLPVQQCQFANERLLSVKLIFVAAPGHALAAYGAPIPASVISQHVQLVLTDRSDLSTGRDFGVFSPRTWRLADLGAKHAFLRAGLGWGGMPLEAVQDDLASGALVPIELEDPLAAAFAMPMCAVYRTESPPGPAGRWLIERLKHKPANTG
jgi:DNA-binding transcriptional LysR family regulator